jgi:hypothetical protein
VISVEDDQEGTDARGKMLESIIGEHVRPELASAVVGSYLLLLIFVAAIEW